MGLQGMRGMRGSMYDIPNASPRFRLARWVFRHERVCVGYTNPLLVRGPDLGLQEGSFGKRGSMLGIRPLY